MIRVLQVTVNPHGVSLDIKHKHVEDVEFDIKFCTGTVKPQYDGLYPTYARFGNVLGIVVHIDNKIDTYDKKGEARFFHLDLSQPLKKGCLVLKEAIGAYEPCALLGGRPSYAFAMKGDTGDELFYIDADGKVHKHKVVADYEYLKGGFLNQDGKLTGVVAKRNGQYSLHRYSVDEFELSRQITGWAMKPGLFKRHRGKFGVALGIGAAVIAVVIWRRMFRRRMNADDEEIVEMVKM